ncbi:amylo-alpha-1,6-glucosidase [Cytophagaceae bacterium YF14B1]|uniref:Amylo-alpha-1,6-glucosidase n=1 Tax=Xanthocytophaga flava TaxID=3048013 RepID=A0AAE3QVJ9_9BACT|nr:amylo-alpha-1,6-glucosidase [Xanthocytophaga flavus]MDJ1484060.1 amylo-alpha-1,6-glucosidase [Xanthocytophaga flavus]
MITDKNQTQSSDEDKYYITAESVNLDDRTQVLNHCETFGIFNRSGDIVGQGDAVQGIYHRDTRYINRLGLKINNLKPIVLSSNVKEENEILSVDLTNPEMVSIDGDTMHHGTIHIGRSQLIRYGVFYEKIEIENYNAQACRIDLSIELGSDFKDIFEVRGLRRQERGLLYGYEYPDNRSLRMSYQGLDDILRRVDIAFSDAYDKISGFEKGEVTFQFLLHPKKKVSLHYSITFEAGNEHTEKKDFNEALKQVEPDLIKTKAYFPVIKTSNGQFTHWISRSKADLVSLMSQTPYGKYPYAGVPWYNTAFGRDGIITALEVLWAAPDLARDVLFFLAANQANTLNESTDAEPGKILHETRDGEMVALNEVPFKQYYGTIDATPLFVILAGEYYDRTGDLETIQKIWSNIVNAINWINQYGDIDDDGFVEYQHKAKNGLTNQGWKDSFDSVFHSNGQLADPPIALCEVQAYVYGAKLHASNLARILDQPKQAETWKNEAKALKEKFNEVFWDKDLNCYVLALDGQKRPCKVKTSNAGQVLFTGIADRSKAKKLVETLMAPDMFSGWGIRTLSTQEFRYNPMSYHNGSIWPHDVALIANGMAKYGFEAEALQLMSGLFDASLYINLQRLPELFCGMDRRAGEGPTAYPVACSPQAWSVGAVYMFLKSILQIKISPLRKEVSFHKPILPEYLQSIEIKKLRIGDSFVDLEITRHGADNMIGVNWNNTNKEWRLIVVK